MRGLWTDSRACGVCAYRARRVEAFVVLCGGARFRSAALLCVLSGASLCLSAPAFAIPQRGHVFSFAFGQKGKGEGELSGPSGIAVSSVTGDVYVADRKNKRVLQFKPVMNGEGELVGEEYVTQLSVPSASAVAVDDSVAGPDPSKGDVYVVGGGKGVYKFSSEGAPIGEIKKFELTGGEGASKLEAIDGIAVDSNGALFVYQEDGVIYRFNDAESNEGESSVRAGVSQQGKPGLALDSDDDFYVGVQTDGREALEREQEEGRSELPVVAKLDGSTGDVLIPELDGEDTSAVAVNQVDEPGNEVDEQNDVYIANITRAASQDLSTMAAFNPEGGLIQRFGAPGLVDADAIAVDTRTGAVYVADAASDQVNVFELEHAGRAQVRVSAQTLPPVPPLSNVTKLVAQVNPTGVATRYFFEYGPASCAAIPSACTKTEPATAGEGFGDVEETVELQDLAPGTYHCRVIAENSFGTVNSAERTFTILALVSGLPDARAWEMVTPPEKPGAAIEALTREGGLILAAEDGDAITYVTEGALTEEAQGNRTPEQQQVLATRGSSEWSSHDIATPQSRAQGVAAGVSPEYRFFSSDLSLALVEPWATSVQSEPPLAPEAKQQTIYLRDNADGTYLPLVTEANVPPGTAFGHAVRFLGATPDLSHVVVDSGVALTGGTSGPGLYEWSAGKLQFVSELPEGTPAGEPVLGYSHVSANAISSGGARVIWTDSGEEQAHLYLRDTASGQTIQLDAAVEGVSEPPEGSAEYQTASSDGWRVFFTDKQRLTRDSTAEAGQALGKPDLYECEIVEEAGKLVCHLKDLTVDQHEGEHADVQGLLFGASEDGSSVYFVARGVLAANENSNGEAAVTGGENLYELHQEGAEWRTTFIAALSGEDSPEWEGGEHADTAFLTARVSPNGRYLAFMSSGRLTGYDNEDVSSEHVGERLDEEVYLYDSSTASLTCVSCNPTGERPTGVLDTQDSGEGLGPLVDRRQIWHGRWLAGNIPGWTSQSLISALFQSRYLSNEGRLFFNSADALVPGVTVPTREEEVAGSMQRVGVENVYEYEPAGVGSCEGSSGGCVALISGGTSEHESAFLEATPSGDDVFFLTAAQLLPQDTDTAFDIYDARVCTQESPCLPPPPPAPAGCGSAAACRPGAPPQQAPIGAAGSARFSGPGNPLIQPPPATQEVKATKTSTKPLTRAQKLADALRACKKQHPHSKQRQKACEAHAHKLYGPKQRAGKTASGQGERGAR
jgi:DNA-binding beta-propeller fold protein YncE